jgi:hypothetical protein
VLHTWREEAREDKRRLKRQNFSPFFVPGMEKNKDL